MVAPARTGEQRRRDTLHRLEQDVDAWVASSADATGAYLVPLSFWWDGAALLLATPATSRTGRNLAAAGSVRLAIGPPRDVVMIDGAVEVLYPPQLPEVESNAFAAKTGFDPRRGPEEYAYFRVRPIRIQAWRESNELADRDLMRDGRWLVPA